MPPRGAVLEIATFGSSRRRGGGGGRGAEGGGPNHMHSFYGRAFFRAVSRGIIHDRDAPTRKIAAEARDLTVVLRKNVL